MKLDVTWRVHPHQRALLEYVPPPGLDPGPIIIAGLGGWGCGKNYIASKAFARACLANGWHGGYGKERPQAAVISPNLTLAVKNQLELVDASLPKELVRKRWTRPDPRILLANGVEIHALSADAAVEGGNWVACWVDEIAHPIYADHSDRMTNWVARLREPRGIDPHPKMFITGLPTAGYVRDLLDRPTEPTIKTFLWSTSLNKTLSEGYREAVYKMTPAGEELTFLEGKWQPVPNALFPQYDERQHLVDDDGNRAQPVDIALDVGNRSSLLVGQRRVIPGAAESRLHIVDEVIGAGLSAEEQIVEFRKKGWIVEPAKSTISVDPTIRRDELREIYSAFPNVHVVQRKREDPLYDVKRGIRLVQTGLRNAKGETRLTFHRGLTKNRYGVIDAMTRLRFSDKTGEPAVQDSYDHPADSLRYLACTVLGPQLAPLVIR